MSYWGFLARYPKPHEEARAFGIWLGEIKDNILPESKWLELWEQFNEPVKEREDGRI